MNSLRKLRWIAPTAALAVFGADARAVTLSIDYTFDTNNFFGAGNPQGNTAGLQAKATLEAAAGFFSGILNDSFSKIQTPPVFHSSTFDGQATWQWTNSFTHPATGSNTVLTDTTIAANQYVIYAGARSLSLNTAGVGGPGGYTWSVTPTGTFTQAELNQLNATTAQFSDAVTKRGQASGFSRWGGAITFDRDGSTVWSYDHTAQPSGNITDFYSVAVHELAHALGFGGSTDWNALVSGSTFTGTNAVTNHGGTPVPLAAGLAHWLDSTNSTIYGSGLPQETAMDPSILNGTRKYFTDLDAAALKDIGWSVPQRIPGDANLDGHVDSADFTIVASHFNKSATVYTTGDFNGDNVTNALDFNALATHFGQVASASVLGAPISQTLVPEPAMLACLLPGTVLALGKRRAGRCRSV